MQCKVLMIRVGWLAISKYQYHFPQWALSLLSTSNIPTPTTTCPRTLQIPPSPTPSSSPPIPPNQCFLSADFQTMPGGSRCLIFSIPPSLYPTVKECLKRVTSKLKKKKREKKNHINICGKWGGRRGWVENLPNKQIKRLSF